MKKLLLFFLIVVLTFAVGVCKNYIVVFKSDNAENSVFNRTSLIKKLNNSISLIPEINFEEKNVKYSKLWISNSIKVNTDLKTINSIKKNSSVKYVFEDFLVTVGNYDNEQFLNDINSENIQEDNQENSILEALPLAHWGVKFIHAPNVWMKYKARGQGVRIGVIDTGINPNHEAIRGKILRYKNFVNPKNVKPFDDNGHGSHVAGIICGSRSLGKFVGVAPMARLVVAKITNPKGQMMYSTLVKAMQWMVDPDNNPKTNDRPVAVNCSLHFPTIKTAEAMKHFNNMCLNLLKLNIVPVFGAGNDFSEKNGKIYLLNNSPFIITVGAIGPAGRRVPFSRIGAPKTKKPDMMAPGHYIPSCSNVDNSGLIIKKGTSMAAPHVTGVIALMKNVNPKLNAIQIMKVLKQSCHDIDVKGFDNKTGYGWLDAMIAVKKAISLKK